MKIITCLLLLIVSLSDIKSQSIDEDQYIYFDFEKLTLAEALRKLDDLGSVSIGYSIELLDKVKIINLQGKFTIDEALHNMLDGTRLKYTRINDRYLIKKRRYYDIYGYVSDQYSGESLIQSTVRVPSLNIATYTNEFGYYHIQVPEGKHDIVFRYIGKKQTTKSVDLNGNVNLDCILKSNLQLEEIIVTPNAELMTTRVEPMRQTEILKWTHQSPGVGGNADVIHTLRALPGVHSGGGSTGGLYVRGGGSDHNMVILDGVTVYNHMHLMGLQSIFDASSIRGIQFYTSALSAKYGGRLSSVIDIQTNEGRPDHWSASVHASQKDAGGHLSGPLLKNKGSFWVSGRRSSFIPFGRRDLFRGYFFSDESTERLSYYDLNAKISMPLTKNSRVYASYYSGRDIMAGVVEDDSLDIYKFIYERELVYGNRIWSLRWNQNWSPQLFSNTTFNFSRFYNEVELLEIETFFDPEEFYYNIFTSTNSELSLKTDFEWGFKNHYLKFGVNVKGYEFTPQVENYDELDSEDEIEFNIDSLNLNNLVTNKHVDDIKAEEINLYLEDEVVFFDNFTARIGLRATYFAGENAFFRLEPRLTLLYKPAQDWAMTASLVNSNQFIHRLYVEDLGLPQDIWYPAGLGTRPQSQWQLDWSAQYNPVEFVQLKAQVYYKRMTNLIQLNPDLLSVIVTEDIDESLIEGSGHSLGLELSTEAKIKELSTYISYTLSKSNRKFEAINEGKSYPHILDARHYLNLKATYQFGRYWTANMNAHYSSPRPKIEVEQAIESFGIASYGNDQVDFKHQSRWASQYRLDASFSYIHKSQKWEHKISFGAYNLLNKVNPSFTIMSDGSGSMDQSMHIGFTPYLKYNIRFN